MNRFISSAIPGVFIACLIVFFATLRLNAEDRSPQQRTRPNIIFIMSDDHAEKAISSYGHGLNHTPNIDRLADEGVRFTQACVSNSICAPSRAVILTGKHSHKNGLVNNASVFDGKQMTFPKLLQQAGYQTAVVGKWHLKSEPTGFDYWKVLPGQGHYYNPDFNEMGSLKKEKGYVSELITQFSLDWLQQFEQGEQPFCLLMQHKAPHRNWMPAPQHLNRFDSIKFPVPEHYFDTYANGRDAARSQKMSIAHDMYPGYDLKLSEVAGSSNLSSDGMDWCFQRMDSVQRAHWDAAYWKKNEDFHEAKLSGNDLALWKYQRYMQDYLATVQSVDESVGMILDWLDTHGLASNTLVIYTSDQGFYLGEHGWFDKRFMYEESLSTPLLVRYPNEIKGQWVSDALVQNLDFAETILDYAGVDIPQDMQGLSLRPILEQKKQQMHEALYYHYYEYPAEHAVKRHYGIRSPNYKLIHYYYDIDAWELYDLKNDPLELYNRYDDPAYEQIKNALHSQLDALRKTYEVPALKTELGQAADSISHLGIDAHYQSFTKASPKYYPGENTLHDGIIYEPSNYWSRGYEHFYGFEGQDMLLKIDLGDIKKVKRIACRFLTRPGAWIYGPSKVRISFSEDGKRYHSLEGQLLTESMDVLTYGMEGEALNMRFIKIDARNHGVIAEGKAGAGNRAWLFSDEVIIE